VRALLIVALAVSLWPAGAIAAIAITGGDQTTESRSNIGSGATETEAEPAPATVQEIEAELNAESKERERVEADKKLVPIVDKAHNLSDEFVQVEHAEGVPEPEFVERGNEVEAELIDWNASQGYNASRRARLISKAMLGQLIALQSLAESPDEASLDAYNEAIETFNRALKGG
jgi:hypothetical protein